MPVKATVDGFAKYGDDQEPRPVDFEVDFIDFIIAKPYGYFNPPSDIWCEGREEKSKLPPISDYFQYTSEQIFYYDFPDEAPPIVAIITKEVIMQLIL